MPDNPKVQAKILRSGQYQIDTNRYIVQAPKIFKRTKEQEIDESTKRIDELRSEIRTLEEELTKKIEKSEHDAEEILDKAEQEAKRLIDEAEKSAFNRVQKSLDEKEGVIEDKSKEIDDMMASARTDAQNIVEESHKNAEEIKEEARENGFNKGREEGFEFAKQEVEHMVGRLHSIIQATLEERERILVHSERQIINLVLTMVRKIVKRLTDEEQNMVVYNIQSALELIRGAMKVYIRVNPSDYRYTLEHKDALIRMIEGMPEVKFFEDPTIAKGGVFVETDIGEVDATVASQLEEIESQMKYYIPVKVKPKGLEDVKAEPKIEQEGSAVNYNENFTTRPDLPPFDMAGEKKNESVDRYRDIPTRSFDAGQSVPDRDFTARPVPVEKAGRPLEPAPQMIQTPVIDTKAPVAAPKHEDVEPMAEYGENSLTVDETAAVSPAPKDKLVTAHSSDRKPAPQPVKETAPEPKPAVPEQAKQPEPVAEPEPAAAAAPEVPEFPDLPGADVEPAADTAVFPLEDFVAPSVAEPVTEMAPGDDSHEGPDVMENATEDIAPELPENSGFEPLDDDLVGAAPLEEPLPAEKEITLEHDEFSELEPEQSSEALTEPGDRAGESSGILDLMMGADVPPGPEDNPG